ncbi:MAG: aromatic amino acid lyase, partial [Thermodesulfobacteriota bacterium]
MKNPFTIDDSEVRIADFISIAYERRTVQLSKDAAWRQKIQKSRECLEQTLSAGKPVYGVSTGVGYDSCRTVEPEDSTAFAYQIFRQHGCGLGEPFSEPEGRAIVFSRLVCLAKGYSAVGTGLLEALCDLLNKGVIPVIPSLGSVGASGDLTPLSYVAAVLAGELALGSWAWAPR